LIGVFMKDVRRRKLLSLAEHLELESASKAAEAVAIREQLSCIQAEEDSSVAVLRKELVSRLDSLERRLSGVLSQVSFLETTIEALRQHQASLPASPPADIVHEASGGIARPEVPE